MNVDAAILIAEERKPVRWGDYDYSSAGAYFITINEKYRQAVFGSVMDGDMVHSAAGLIAARCLQDIHDHFPMVTVDCSVVMPDHVHAILAVQTDSIDLTVSSVSSVSSVGIVRIVRIGRLKQFLWWSDRSNRRYRSWFGKPNCRRSNGRNRTTTASYGTTANWNGSAPTSTTILAGGGRNALQERTTMPASSADPSVAILPAPVEPSASPFGKRYAAQTITLTSAHLAALHAGQTLALDIQNEYVVHLRLEPRA
jgi:REP element-mobilizing transposase RayT